ncbi:MAG: hypothetical protein ACFCVE_06630 [Phycisphaerae bacterium]
MPVLPGWSLLLLLVVFGLSLWMFLSLVGRYTRGKNRAELHAWCRRHRLHVIDPPAVPEALAELLPGMEPTQAVADEHRFLLAGTLGGQTLHVLACRREIPLPALALRSLRAAWALPDAHEWPVNLGATDDERFLLLAQGRFSLEQTPAAPALLPPDVSLMQNGVWLFIDFSGRPFDMIEFDRMLILARQLEP